MTVLLSLLFTLQYVTIVLSVTLTPLAPIITPPPVPPGDTFDETVGWYFQEGTYFAASCGSSGEGWIFSTKGYYAECCPHDEDCTWSTRCSGNTVYWTAGSTTGSTTCGSDACNSDTIYGHSTSDSNRAYWIGCVGRAEQEFYRQLPILQSSAMATPSVQGTGTTSLPLAPLSSPTSSISWPTQESSTSVSSLAATQASNQGTGTPDSKPKKHKTRNAWISGVVIGAVALLAIIALAFHLIRTRNRNNKNLGQIPYQAAPTTSHIYGQPPQVYPNSPSIMATVPTELPNGYGDISPYPGYKGGFAMMGTVLAPGQGEQRPSQDMNGRTTWVSQDGTVASSEPGQTEISHTTQSISELPELVSTPGQSGARGRK